VTTYPRTGLQRILAGAPDPELRAVIYDQDGDPVDTAPGTVTCTITRADGTAVATGRACTTSTSAVTCELTTAEAQTLDVLSAVWSVNGVVRHRSWHRIVGAFPFSIPELAKRAGIAEGFDRAELRTERDRITDLVEEYVGAVVPRYDLEQWRGTGGFTHALAHRPLRRIRSLIVDGDPDDIVDLDEVDYAAGVVSGDVLFHGDCVLGYEHGRDLPPADLRDAMLTAAADRLLREWSTIGPRVRSISDGMGVTQQLSYAGKDHPTGLDEVDAIIMRYSRRGHGIG
jgi:hypothetical protein